MGERVWKVQLEGFVSLKTNPVLFILKGLSSDYMGDSGDYIVKAADYNNPLVTWLWYWIFK